MTAGVALAKQDDGVLEHLSGPGPFIRWPSLDIRVLCITNVDGANHTVPLVPWAHGSGAEFAFRPYRRGTGTATVETAKEKCSNDREVRGYLSVAYGHYSSVENNLFPARLTDDQFKVHAESISVRFMGRTAAEAVDIGFGLDMFMFHGKAFDSFARVAIEPVRLSVAPFVALGSSQRSRAFHLTVAPTIFLGTMNQDNFCNGSGCTDLPRPFTSKAEIVWATSIEVDVLTLIRGGN
jgi:hypothetical protein